MLEALKQDVFEANLELYRRGVVLYTWGNVSGIDRSEGVFAIKPSGVPYEEMRVEDIVLMDLEGRCVEGNRRPSSDEPTHRVLYRAFPEMGGVVHTHSPYACMFAQARRGIPCLGTTHADTFYGEIPCTRLLTDEEISGEYEAQTGTVIVERFASVMPMQVPGALVAGHGPFAWGADAADAVVHAVILEEVAKMASGTLALNPDAAPIPQSLLDRHYLRKHGAGAYYGQPG